MIASPLWHFKVGECDNDDHLISTESRLFIVCWIAFDRTCQ